jgi:hypothetical protein
LIAESGQIPVSGIDIENWIKKKISEHDASTFRADYQLVMGGGLASVSVV